MTELELFPRPPAYNFVVRLKDDGWWTVLACRLHPERPPEDRDRETYERLSLAEAIDVIAGVMLTD